MIEDFACVSHLKCGKVQEESAEVACEPWLIAYLRCEQGSGLHTKENSSDSGYLEDLSSKMATPEWGILLAFCHLTQSEGPLRRETVSGKRQYKRELFT